MRRTGGASRAAGRGGRPLGLERPLTGVVAPEGADGPLGTRGAQGVHTRLVAWITGESPCVLLILVG